MTKARRKEAGFTLMELVIVIVVIGVLAAYAAMRGGSPGMYTVLSQAETMASNLRHAQTLASTLGKRLRVTNTSNSYSVGCATSIAYPCNTELNEPMINPTTGSAFTVSLEKDVSFFNIAAPLVIDSWGMPGASATYQLSVGGSVAKQVKVEAVTGFVSIP